MANILQHFEISNHSLSNANEEGRMQRKALRSSVCVNHRTRRGELCVVMHNRREGNVVGFELHAQNGHSGWPEKEELIEL